MQSALANPSFTRQEDADADTLVRVAVRRWLRMAVVYFVIAVGLGVFMGASGDHSLSGVHVHLNMLGWVSPALIGFIYAYFPQAALSRLASVQFWLHNASLPVMMLALGLLLKGNPGVEPLLGATSVLMLLTVLLFALNVLRQRD